jgi:hypothetical protein
MDGFHCVPEKDTGLIHPDTAPVVGDILTEGEKIWDIFDRFEDKTFTALHPDTSFLYNRSFCRKYSIFRQKIKLGNAIQKQNSDEKPEF